MLGAFLYGGHIASHHVVSLHVQSQCVYCQGVGPGQGGCSRVCTCMYVRGYICTYMHTQSFRGQVAGVFTSVEGGATNRATSRLVCCGGRVCGTVGFLPVQWCAHEAGVGT